MTYFAKLVPEEFIKEADTKINAFYDYIESQGVAERWRASYRAYYGAEKSSSTENVLSINQLKSTGSRNELTKLKVNHYRNILQHSLVLTTSQRPAFDVRATNTDYKSQTQAVLGNGILDYYMREKQLEQYLKTAVEQTLLWGEGHLLTQWNPNKGEPFGVNENGRVVREGDVEYSNPTPFDVIRDPNNSGEHDWLIVRVFLNKYDLASKFPDKEVSILSASSEDKKSQSFLYNLQLAESDKIPVYLFYHNKTDSLPNGRFTIFLDSSTYLLDGGLPYREIPLYTMMPSRIFNTPFGYTPAYDALPLQEAVDILSSTILSNQRSFGIQRIWQQTGNGITVDDLSEGLSLLTSDTEPRALQLTATPPEVFNNRSQMVADMETIFGINSVVRGNPEASLKSGAALALVASQSVQFSSGLSQSYNMLLESVGTQTLVILRDYAKTKRVASILGINARGFMKEFSGDDLSSVNRVVVEVGSAISKTTAGKIEIANQLLQTGLIKNADQYLMVVNTGKLEPMIESQTSELLLIRSENEMLKNGQLPAATVLDNHALHIQEHNSVLSDPESRKDASLVQATLKHINDHLALWRKADPAILAVTKQQPAPQAMPPQQVMPVDPQI